MNSKIEKQLNPLKKTVYSSESNKLMYSDLIEGTKNIGTSFHMAFLDIKQRFKRSVLGPFWITLSMAIFVFSLGLVMSTVFNQDIDDLLPYIATGMIFWSLFSSSLLEACNVFTENAGYIKNVPCSKISFLFRMLARNFLIFLHNMLIYLFIFVIFKHEMNLNYLWFLVGFPIFLINMTWITLSLAFIAARYRDTNHIVVNLIQVLFFLTPIFWSIETIPNRPAYIDYNPIYHLLEIVRSPLLGLDVTLKSWVFTLALIIPGYFIALWIYSCSLKRITYWV